MKKTRNEKFFDVITNDEREFFCAVVHHFKEVNPMVNFWGKIPKEVQGKLYSFKVKENWILKVRKILFNEHLYVINSEQNKDFINTCKSFDFVDITWGIRKNDDIIVFARSADDINVSSSKLITLEGIRSLLEKLQHEKIVKKFEVIDE